MKPLQQKIKAVETEHAEQAVEANLTVHSERQREQALLLLGGIRAVDRITDNLSSQVMEALIRFQKDGLHEQFGYERFADFLDKSELSPMKKSEYYRRKELYDAEGGPLYDTFNAARIPISTRRLLAAKNGTEIAIEGDEIVIGDERANLSDLPTIKALINDFASDNRKLLDQQEKQKAKIEDLTAKIERGEAENEELRRNLDGMNETSRIQRAYLHAVNSLLLLEEAVGELGEAEKQERHSDLDQIAVLFYKLTDAYGVKRSLSDTAPAGDSVDDRILRKMADEGDFEDLDDLD